MNIAALIFGILGGLSSLPLASYAHALIGLFGASGGGFVYLIPLASFLGGSLALAQPGLAAGLMGASAGILLLIGANYGYAVNIITIGPVMLSGLGAVLAFLSYQASPANKSEGGPARTAPVNIGTSHALTTARVATVNYDRTKWNALIKYDEDIARVAEKVRELGDKWYDVFAADYLALNDKQYLPEMVRKIVAAVKQEKEQQEQAKKRREEAERYEALEEERLREKLKQEREQALRNRMLFFWGSPIRRLATGAALVVVIAGVGMLAWYSYQKEQRAGNDPFIYCRFAGTKETEAIMSDPAWRGDASPEILARKLNVPQRAFRWRCANGGVYACVHSKGNCHEQNSYWRNELWTRIWND